MLNCVRVINSLSQFQSKTFSLFFSAAPSILNKSRQSSYVCLTSEYGSISYFSLSLSLYFDFHTLHNDTFTRIPIGFFLSSISSFLFIFFVCVLDFHSPNCYRILGTSSFCAIILFVVCAMRLVGRIWMNRTVAFESCE